MYLFRGTMYLFRGTMYLFRGTVYLYMYLFRGTMYLLRGTIRKKGKKKMSNLMKKEYSNLCKKVNNGYFPVDYFRRNFFTIHSKGTIRLKEKKTIYEDTNVSIKINIELNQKHRDLLSLLMYEDNTQPDEKGNYQIITNLYQLAKKMGYYNPKGCINIIYSLLDDLRNTSVYIRDIKARKRFGFMLIGNYYYDEESSDYKINIPYETTQYIIYTTGVLIPRHINQKIVLIPNNKSKLKALISFMLSNKPLIYGIYFDTICEKFDILERNRKSDFKRLIKNNSELLEEFKIYFKDNKIYLDEQIVDFERAITLKDTNSDNSKDEEFLNWLNKFFEVYENKAVCKYIIDDDKKTLYLKDKRIYYFIEDISTLVTDKKLEDEIFQKIYSKKELLKLF